MFLAIVSNLPKDYDFYLSNHSRLQDVLKVFPVKESGLEFIIFRHYEDADDLKYNFDQMEIWCERKQDFCQLKIKCFSLCFRSEE